jgi:hypothetical protein
MKKYQIVRQFNRYHPVDIDDFEKTVTKYLIQGWKCVGGVVHQHYSDDGSNMIMQAMIWENDE